MSTSANDVTLDATPLPPGATGTAPKINVVEGSGPKLDCETRDVRRKRMQIASFVLFLAFGVFLVWRLLSDLVLGIPKVNLDDGMATLLWISHAAVTVLLAVSAANFCRKCVLSNRLLLVKEILIFGAPVVFLSIMQFASLPQALSDHGMMPNVSTPWMLLAFVYALFIPNCWRRSLPAIATYCVMPILIIGLLAAFHAECRSHLLANPTTAVEVTLVMLITGAASLIGVHTINNLRREAFRAKQLGQYRLRHLLGAGGMGEVFLAEHQLMKRPCAIKLIRPEKAGDPRMLARFEREVKATAKLSHWNSIEIYDYGRTADGAFYYVMEYLPGMSLAEIVEKHGPLPPQRVIHFLRQTCNALEEAHGVGLIHRDIKPANIFAAERGGIHDVTKLLDFGLAKPSRTPAGDAGLTQDGSITGSPLFMSPEQIEGDGPLDARADLYALGIVGYYLLTGRAPFENQSSMQILVAHLRDAPPAPSDFADHVPHDLEAILLRCLQKAPADRYQSAADLAAALDGCELAGTWSTSDANRWWQEVAGRQPAIDEELESDEEAVASSRETQVA